MGTSGNPAKRGESPISTASDFKKKRAGVVELPSGMVVQLKNPGGLRIFMANGSIPNSLMPIIKESLDSGQAPEAKDAAELIQEDIINDMMSMMDNIAVACFVNPRCWPTPASEDERDDEKLYADEVEDEDKMFIFQWVSGGTSDVEKFREEQARNVASVSGLPKVGS